MGQLLSQMNAISLKLLFLVSLVFGCSFFVKGQNPHFIYIQTENKQPFYVKTDNKFLSSSAAGYIIIAKLTTGVYKLVIGSPVNEWPELNVTLSVKDINTGYLLKKSTDQHWNLVNLQTQASLAVEKQPFLAKTAEIISDGDMFAKILAEVVNDPSIGQVITVKKSSEPIVIATADKNAVIPATVESAKTEPVKTKEAPFRVTKLVQDSTASGLPMTYIDRADFANDTIKMIIPATEPVAAAREKVTAVERDSRFIDMELQNPNLKTDSGAVKKGDLVITEKKAVVNNSSATESQKKTAALSANKELKITNCKKAATQNDFLKLRKQMAAEENEKDMTRAASKQFINTCFTTEQVKNLGILYITEDEKYKFFVNAFPYITDANNFGALENELSDIYYKTRFKAMLSH